MFSAVISYLRQGHKTLQEQYTMFTDEIKAVYQSWNIPNDRCDVLIRYGENAALIKNQPETWCLPEEYAKRIINDFTKQRLETDYYRFKPPQNTKRKNSFCCLVTHSLEPFSDQLVYYPKIEYYDNALSREFTDKNLDAVNLIRKADVYRIVNGLQTASDLNMFCKRLRISPKTLSSLLGWDSDTIDSFLTGEIQSNEKDALLCRLISNPDHLLDQIEQCAGDPNSPRNEIEDAIRALFSIDRTTLTDFFPREYTELQKKARQIVYTREYEKSYRKLYTKRYGYYRSMEYSDEEAKQAAETLIDNIARGFVEEYFSLLRDCVEDGIISFDKVKRQLDEIINNRSVFEI